MVGNSVYCATRGVYSSPRGTVKIPADPSLSMVRFLLRNASSYPNRVALADTNSGRSFTFGELEAAINRVAAGISRLGVAKGDVVLIFSPNCIDFPLCFFAVISLGAIVTTVNPLYTVSELSKQTADSGARLVITVPQLFPKVRELRLPTVILGPSKLSVAEAAGASIVYLPDLLQSVGDSPAFVPPAAAQTDVAALFYSSGTTGANKGVELTHRNFIAASLMVTAEQDLRGDPPHVCLCFLPMFHIFGLSLVTYAQLQRGTASSPWAVQGHLNPPGPPVVIALAKQGKVTSYDLSSLRQVICGAAPLGKDIMEEASKIYPDVEIFQGYGLTESCGIISLEVRVEGVRQYGSAGFLVPGVEAKVINVDTGVPLPPNGVGELCFRGDNIMRGYFNNLEATAWTLDKEGWLHTGDLGYFDDEGKLYVVDRIKELIKYKGFQVAPAELEGLLLSHPEILDAVVVPLPDEEAGEVPIAYVVRATQSSLTEADVQKFIAVQVAPFKRLRKVSFIDSVPKSASGKILRRVLIDRIRSRQ
ncbi:unnamed protein product [Spirodela intermedia]|uniref:4-coumarate--CoA ligase n=1 Tax=Spirodela intermedia TaxID=51605 RepID=A0A7I8J926_SPIIN|nr:unnamed protein product [Spirodela intermedia]CAA6666560.1 unnamed protein product [Spirodela intermedia]